MALKSARTSASRSRRRPRPGSSAGSSKVGDRAATAAWPATSPASKVTPTMTAEAWACRQFLEVGGPGPASDEAAAFLLRNRVRPAASTTSTTSITAPWPCTSTAARPGRRWNARVRDQVVRRQHSRGTGPGAGTPTTARYGTHGGRIYGTALATLTLEVYYRFLRLYGPTATPSPAAPRAGRPATRRAGIARPELRGDPGMNRG